MLGRKLEVKLPLNKCMHPQNPWRCHDAGMADGEWGRVKHRPVT